MNLTPVVWFFGLFWVRKIPNHYYWFFVFFGLYLFFLIMIICRQRIDRTFLRFLIMPFGWSIGSLAMLFFVIGDGAYYALTIFCGLLLYLLLRQYYIYFYFPNKYQAYSLESLTFYVVIFSLFFFSAASFAALALVQMRWYFLAPILAVLLMLILYQFFWMNKVDFIKSKIFILPITLILLELILALSYLPIGYFANGFVVAASGYVMLTLTKAQLQGSLNKKSLWWTLVIFLVSLLLILLTTRWS